MSQLNVRNTISRSSESTCLHLIMRLSQHCLLPNTSCDLAEWPALQAHALGLGVATNAKIDADRREEYNKFDPLVDLDKTAHDFLVSCSIPAVVRGRLKLELRDWARNFSSTQIQVKTEDTKEEEEDATNEQHLSENNSNPRDAVDTVSEASFALLQVVEGFLHARASGDAALAATVCETSVSQLQPFGVWASTVEMLMVATSLSQAQRNLFHEKYEPDELSPLLHVGNDEGEVVTRLVSIEIGKLFPLNYWSVAAPHPLQRICPDVLCVSSSSLPPC